MSPSCDSLVQSILKLKYLPDSDKEKLVHAAKLGYGHAQALLPSLSIFSSNSVKGSLGQFGFTLTADEPLFYAGFSFKSNLGIFFDRERRIIYNSRYYLTHLNGFIENIDSCIYHLQRLDLVDSIDIGCNFCAIEKWFITYGHYKDEAYNIGAFMAMLPTACGLRALLDYPDDSDLDTSCFKYNLNYGTIDRHIFGSRSVNAYHKKAKVLKLCNLLCISNGFDSSTFHSFPINISSRIKSRAASRSELSTHQRVMVTRSNSYRDICNKEEVESLLVQNGCALINPESLPFDDFVCILQNIKVAFFYYGSALTNLVYLPPKAKVFILKSQSYMQESLDLWGKVIGTYDLEVIEICAISNVIDVDMLQAVCGLDESP